MPAKKSPVSGLTTSAEQAKYRVSDAGVSTKKSPKPSHIRSAAKARSNMPGDGALASDRLAFVEKTGLKMSNASDTIDLIRSWHRQRCFAMEQRKRIDLSLGSFIRMMLGWSPNLPEETRRAIAAQAADLMNGKDQDDAFDAVIAASSAARTPFDQIEAQALKEMTALAKTLPVWKTFAEDVRGFGAPSLAVIIGEAGDLSNYSSVAKLWKRMGLAVMDGIRQGGLPKGAKAEDWIEHGYKPVRRSRMWNIGDALIKSNQTGDYRTAYLARKEYELARDPEMKPIKAHRRAQRYMEKRLLKHLWQAWRRTRSNSQPDSSLSAVIQDRGAA